MFINWNGCWTTCSTTRAKPEGEIHVALAAAGGWADIHVRDNGPGFSPEAREHLFEPFHTTKRGGSGLGLASWLTIVQAHGGEIVLANGAGCEIRVRLPAF